MENSLKLIFFVLLGLSLTQCNVKSSTNHSSGLYSYKPTEVFPFNDINCISISKYGKLAFAAGNIGTMMKSLDSGKTWIRIGKGLAEDNLSAVSIDDKNQMVWTVGEKGTCLVSKNAGLTWTKVDLGIPVTNTLNDIALENNGQSIWIIGNNNTLIHSNDYGNTWAAISVNLAYNNIDFARIRFSSDGKSGWIAADNGILIHTSDGGQNWKNIMKLEDSYSIKEAGLSGIFISNRSNTTYIGGEHGTLLIYHENSEAPVILKNRFKGAITGLYFEPNEKTGWAVTSDTSIVYKTTDGGTTWQEDYSFPNPNKGYNFLAEGPGGDLLVAGIAGIILRKRSDEATFHSEDKFIRYGMEEVHSIGDRVVAVGWHGTILYSTDGGSKWDQSILPTDESINSLKMLDSNNYWISGTNGLLMHTADGGKQWENRSFIKSETINSIDFTENGQVGLFVTTLGKIFRSTDSGRSWINIPFGGVGRNLSVIKILPDNKVWLVGDKGTLYTSANLGTTWAKQPMDSTVNLRTIAFDGTGTTGFIAANSINPNANIQGYRSLNGGRTWTKIIDAVWNFTSNDICMNHNASSVYAISQLGNIFLSPDTGLHWFMMSPRISLSLANCTLVKDSILVATGAFGKLISSALLKDSTPVIEEFTLKEKDGLIHPSLKIRDRETDAAGLSVRIEVKDPLKDWAARSYKSLTFTYDKADSARPWPVEAFEANKMYTFDILVCDGWNITRIRSSKVFGLTPWQWCRQIMHWDILPDNAKEITEAVGVNMALAGVVYTLAVLLLFIFSPLHFVFWHEAVANSRLPFPEKLSKFLVLYLIENPRCLKAFVEYYRADFITDIENNKDFMTRSIWVPSPYEINNKKVLTFSQTGTVGQEEIKAELGPLRVIISVEGIGGIGKSSIAFQIARWSYDKDIKKPLLGVPVLPVFINVVDTDLDKICIRKLERISNRSKISENLGNALLKKRNVLAIVDGWSEMAQVKTDYIDPEKGARSTYFAIYTSRTPVLPGLGIVRIFPMGLKLDFLDSMLDGFTNAYVGAFKFSDRREILRDKVKLLIQSINQNDSDKPVPASILRLMIEKADHFMNANLSLQGLPESIMELIDSYVSDIFRSEEQPVDTLKILRRTALISVGLRNLLDEAHPALPEALKEIGKPRWVYEDLYSSYFGQGYVDKFVLSGLLIRTGSTDDRKMKFVHDPIAEYLAAKEVMIIFRNGKLPAADATRIAEMAKMENDSFYYHLVSLNGQMEAGFPLFTVPTGARTP